MTFEQTFPSHRPSLMRYALRLTMGQVEDAEDLLQTAATRIWLAWDKIVARTVNIAGAFRFVIRTSWLQKLKDQSRGKRAGYQVPIEEWNGGAVEGGQDAAVLLGHVERSIAKMPAKQAHAARMVFLNGYTPREVSEDRGVTKNGVERMVRDARRSLAEQMEELWRVER